MNKELYDKILKGDEKALFVLKKKASQGDKEAFYFLMLYQRKQTEDIKHKADLRYNYRKELKRIRQSLIHIIYLLENEDGYSKPKKLFIGVLKAIDSMAGLFD